MSNLPLLSGSYRITKVHIGNGDSGKLFEVAAGWVAQVRWQRAGGHGFPVNKPLQPEDVVSKWSVITDFGIQTVFRCSPF